MRCSFYISCFLFLLLSCFLSCGNPSSSNSSADSASSKIAPSVRVDPDLFGTPRAKSASGRKSILEEKFPEETPSNEVPKAARSTYQLPLKHHAHLPTKQTSYGTPLLVLLHGYGSNGTDMFSFANYIDERLLVVSVEAPHKLQPERYCWYPLDFGSKTAIDDQDIINSEELLVQFIKGITQQYDVDEDKIYLMGFSQGAMMSYFMGLRNPDLITGVIALSGKIPNMLTEGLEEIDEHKHLSVFAAHGTKDEVISIEEGRDSKQFLRLLPIDLTYKEYRMKHEISPKCLRDVQNWLEEQIERTIF